MVQPGNVSRASHLPELPVEIQLEILQVTARAFPKYAVQLALVSKLVQSSIEAIIYETVVLDINLEPIELFLRTIDSRSPDFFAKNVKGLYITGLVTFSQAERILSVCTGVTDLLCWVWVPLSSGSLLPLIRTRALKRLSARVQPLWTETFESPVRMPCHDLFPNLSHVDIVHPPHFSVAIEWSWIFDLPALTHVSFGSLFVPQHFYVFELLRRLLIDCTLLQTMVVISSDSSFLIELEREEIHDPRLVLLRYSHHPKSLNAYWEGIRRGESDFWASSDEVVARKKREIVQCNGT